jgi:hypothetical protein
MPMSNRSTIENFSEMRPTFIGGGKYRTNRRVYHLFISAISPRVFPSSHITHFCQHAERPLHRT